MRILVSGGAGYIGSVTVAELIKRNDKVIVIDNLSKGHIAAVDRGASFVKGDLNDKGFLEAVFREHQLEGG